MPGQRRRGRLDDMDDINDEDWLSPDESDATWARPRVDRGDLKRRWLDDDDPDEAADDTETGSFSRARAIRATATAVAVAVALGGGMLLLRDSGDQDPTGFDYGTQTSADPGSASESDSLTDATDGEEDIGPSSTTGTGGGPSTATPAQETGAAGEESGAGSATDALRAVVSIDVAATTQVTASAVLVDPSGILVTSSQVLSSAGVGNGDDVTVTLDDGRLLTARVRGVDAARGVAVLVVEKAPSGLSALRLADDDEAATVGERVLVVGRRLGQGRVAAGLVSATWVPRAVGGVTETAASSAAQDTSAAGSGLVSTFEIDQPSARGAGAAVVDTQGRLQGITLPGSAGTVIALPARTLALAVSQLRETGEARYATLGLTAQRADGQVDGARRRAAEVVTVADGGPADGVLRTGDLVVGWDGAVVDGPDALGARLTDAPPGSDVKLDVVRDGATTALTVRLGP